MRILLVNGNTSDEVTETLAEVARAAAGPETEIASATGAFGVRLIGHRAEAAIAEHAVLELIAEHAENVDGILIGVSLDTALRAARAMVDVPVVGMTEAAMLMACMLCGQFGLITFSAASTALYRELVESHGLADRLAGIRTIDVSFAQAFSDRAAMEAPIVEAVEALVGEEGAETLILVGAAGAGLPARLQPRVSVPLLDGITCGVLLVEALIRLDAPSPTRGSYALPPGNQVTGLGAALADRLKERDS
jgi:allantoin racemase